VAVVFRRGDLGIGRRRDVNTSRVELRLPAEAAWIVDDYLATVAALLPAGSRVRHHMLAEIGDGLACAVDAHLADGAVPRQAARAAVVEFGDPRRLAGSLAHELAPATARRTGARLLVTGPLVGLIWVAAYRTGSPNWLSNVVAVLSSVPVLPLVLLVAVPAALVAVAGPGLLARRLTLPPGLVPIAAIIATSAVVLGDATLIGTTLIHGRGTSALIGAAILVSVVRASLAGVAMRRIVRLLAASC
jgi:hypothetical protein